MSVSLVAREHRVSPSLLFRWRKLASEGALLVVGADEPVVPASEVRALQHQVRELQRLLGKKTLENEILKEAAEVAREKSGLCAHRDRRWALSGRHGVSGTWGGAQQHCPPASTGSAPRRAARPPTLPGSAGARAAA